MEQNYIDELLSLIHSNKSDEELREELQKYHENKKWYEKKYSF